MRLSLRTPLTFSVRPIIRLISIVLNLNIIYILKFVHYKKKMFMMVRMYILQTKYSEDCGNLEVNVANVSWTKFATMARIFQILARPQLLGHKRGAVNFELRA